MLREANGSTLHPPPRSIPMVSRDPLGEGRAAALLLFARSCPSSHPRKHKAGEVSPRGEVGTSTGDKHGAETADGW